MTLLIWRPQVWKKPFRPFYSIATRMAHVFIIFSPLPKVPPAHLPVLRQKEQVKCDRPHSFTDMLFPVTEVSTAVPLSAIATSGYFGSTITLPSRAMIPHRL